MGHNFTYKNRKKFIFVLKLAEVLNDRADFINRVYQVRTLTELWDVTLTVKIKICRLFV